MKRLRPKQLRRACPCSVWWIFSARQSAQYEPSLARFSARRSRPHHHKCVGRLSETEAGRCAMTHDGCSNWRGRKRDHPSGVRRLHRTVRTDHEYLSGNRSGNRLTAATGCPNFSDLPSTDGCPLCLSGMLSEIRDDRLPANASRNIDRAAARAYVSTS